jgi:hypothetical protein
MTTLEREEATETTKLSALRENIERRGNNRFLIFLYHVMPHLHGVIIMPMGIMRMVQNGMEKRSQDYFHQLR